MLLGNSREHATIPVTNPSTTHTSTSSTTVYSTLFVIHTTISHVHPQTISCTNITTYNNTPKLAKTTLSTFPTTISTTNNSFVEPVTFPKQIPSNEKNSIKESACVTLPKKRPPTLDIFPSRDIWLKRHKKYSSPFTQLQTNLAASPASNIKSSTSISASTATNAPPKSKYHLLLAQNLPLNS